MYTLKKRVFAIILVLISLLFVGCKNNKVEGFVGAYVKFIDVGQGDCILINLPDDKKVMIDTGNGTKQSDNAIKESLSNLNVKTIDYLILTHPDQDHVGGAKMIAEDYKVVNAFVPYITQMMLPNFLSYSEVYNTMEEKGVKNQTSVIGTHLKGDGYFLAFLTPYAFAQQGSSYEDLNKEDATDKQINDSSPILYLEIYGKRFIFTGDAGVSQEKIVLENFNAGFYQIVFNRQIDIRNVDFLKVAHHGSSDCSSSEFLNMLRPYGAVISVGGNNYYGHPDTELLTRLINCNDGINIYRTDTCGSIAVRVEDNGQMTVITEAD